MTINPDGTILNCIVHDDLQFEHGVDDSKAKKINQP